MILSCREEDVTGLDQEMSSKKVAVRFHPHLLPLRVPFTLSHIVRFSLLKVQSSILSSFGADYGSDV
jgi:hypothetical protein